ncbi:MAG: calcium/sodium antiporter [Clostridia bacterium]|nr:calcium/sodium antiporter [Clostridia bacterium]
MSMVMQIALLILGFAMLVKGADWFVEGTAGIAGKFGIPQLVIGLTIVAMGTSAPETAVSITAALKGSAALSIGNVVGSNLLNVLIILGITAVITPLAVAKSTVKYEIPFMILISFLFFGLCVTGNEIVLWEGIILWVALIAYLAYLLVMAKRNKEEVDEEEQLPLWKLILLTVVGLVLIFFGSDFTVDAATKIATILGMSERFIGLTIVALGTSLPELVTSVSAAIKGKADIAIGNIVGSNIFNLLFVIGTSALITPVVFNPSFAFDMWAMIISGVALWVFAFRKYKLARWSGAVMLVMYAAYFVYLI